MMRKPRRFPRDVAERRLKEIIDLAIMSGKNVRWLSQEDFVVVDWTRHVRIKAVNINDEYVLEVF
ncbi:MAG TPA: hypothetical protein ENF80_03955 [Thermofilum sp.]|nr:hypothetical protein [Thermofilum sp.]